MKGFTCDDCGDNFSTLSAGHIIGTDSYEGRGICTNCLEERAREGDDPDDIVIEYEGCIDFT